MSRLPHPIPYQGSKRALAPLIAPYVPRDVATFYEPFAGSAAVTLYAANLGLAKRFVVGDSLGPIIELWKSIVERPSDTSARYRSVWEGQKDGDLEYFNLVRARYNSERDPVDLLYIIARCVKNAVRFNAKGNFTQSVDKRRLGMRPERMREAIDGASHLLRGRVEFRVGDWLDTLSDAGREDFVYMDPPYLGTSVGRDKRYAEQMAQDRLCDGLAELNARSVRLALSYDGQTGEKVYGPPLPDSLGLDRLQLHAGRSSQATLQGRDDETIESLYLSPGLSDHDGSVIRKPKAIQQELAL
ncbi:MAG: DNA adenine methylase [Parvibaculum sp.]|nr:DNA adenine methylase [Parvibaculum sp.]